MPSSSARPASRRIETIDIGEIIALRLSRRGFLKGTAAGGLFGLFGAASGAEAAASLDFPAIGRASADNHQVAPGYSAQVLLRQGDPLHRGGPTYRPGAQTAAEQAVQFGNDNDFIAYMPMPSGSANSMRGLLGINHESHYAQLCFPGNPRRLTREQCEVQMAAHGFSVIEIGRDEKGWRLIEDSPYNRRITANTDMRASGPAAGSARMRTRADPGGSAIRGTLSNCAGGTTPWRTILTAEENVQSYFSGDAENGPEAAARRRYNITGRGYYPDWGRYFERFDIDAEPNEPNRFGWIVEIDPYDARSTPVKRTALGRFAHECATTALSHDGRVAVYSGDDAPMEHVYKFVSRGRAGESRDVLDDGTLYAARFEANGRMRWLPLVHGEGPLTAANGFESQADVLIEARRAASLLGATPMDRPEDIEAHPANGRVYVVLTSNESRKTADAANPRPLNREGHIIEIVPPLAKGRPDHAAVECDWGVFLLGGDPLNWLVCPDNLAFDPKGRLWIATDGQRTVGGSNDSLYAVQVLGPQRGTLRRFLNGPRGAEITGPAFTPDGTTLFVSVQHPGAERGSTYDNPSSRWPDFRSDTPPRAAVLAITRAGGGAIGG